MRILCGRNLMKKNQIVPWCILEIYTDVRVIFHSMNNYFNTLLLIFLCFVFFSLSLVRTELAAHAFRLKNNLCPPTNRQRRETIVKLIIKYIAIMSVFRVLYTANNRVYSSTSSDQCVLAVISISFEFRVWWRAIDVDQLLEYMFCYYHFCCSFSVSSLFRSVFCFILLLITS